MTELSELINKEETSMNRELFQKQKCIAKRFISYKKQQQQNKQLADLIKGRLRDLKDVTKRMSENEIEIEKPDIMVNTVEKILEFNRQNQEGKGLKILTPQQILSRLPISLAQLKASGNNSEKHKNEIRQPLYSLYR